MLAWIPPSPRRDPARSDEAVVPTEELAIDFGRQGSAVIKGGSSSKLSAPKSSGKLSSGKLSASDSPKNVPNPAGGDSSEFELSLDADSDDFELKLNTEASDEVALGSMPKDPPGRQAQRPAAASTSAIQPTAASRSRRGRRHKPAAPKPDSDSDVDFELTLDSSAGASGVKLCPMKEKKDPESDSEFELTLDDSGGSDIEHAALGARGGGRQGRHL